MYYAFLSRDFLKRPFIEEGISGHFSLKIPSPTHKSSNLKERTVARPKFETFFSKKYLQKKKLFAEVVKWHFNSEGIFES